MNAKLEGKKMPYAVQMMIVMVMIIGSVEHGGISQLKDH